MPRLVLAAAFAALVGLGAWAAWPAAPMREAAVLAAMPEEALPTDPLDASEFEVRQGVGHLLVAAKSGSPLLLQEAEREIVLGLVAGLEATAAGDRGDRVDRGRYDRVFQAYEHAQGVFKDLPYRLVVEPGPGLRGFELPLRRHPWLVVMKRPVAGWRAELIQSGVRLTPAD
jgi:hypothetical protein